MALQSPLFPRPYLGHISGLTLQVEANEDQQSETLTFYKSRTRVVSVGRKSTQGRNTDGAHESDRALFRCPVVSRKHAKITFTEYGNAYIMDLNSHHGTHVLRPGDTISRAIEPGVPTVLADGDMITFGKSVGRDATLVRPVSARVKLILGADPPPANISTSALASPVSEKPSPRSSSGRYGVYLSSESSSDEGSDMEESRSSSSALDVTPEARMSDSSPASRSRGGLELLCRLLPPIQGSFFWSGPLPTSSAPDRDQISSPVKEHDDAAPEDAEVLHSEGNSESLESSPGPFKYNTPPPLEPLVGSTFPGAFPGFYTALQQVPETHYPASPIVHPENFFDHESNALRAFEPFEAESLPPAEMEPCGSEHGSDGSAGAASHEAIAPSTRAASEGISIYSSAGYEPVNDIGAQASPREPLKFTFLLSDLDDNCFGSAPGSPSSTQMHAGSSTQEPAVADSRLAVEDRIEDAQNDITVLRLARRHNEARFEEHVEETKNRLAQLDQRMLEVNAHTKIMSLRLTEARGDIGQLQADVGAAQSARAPEQQSVEANVKACEAALEELKAIRDDATQQIALGLEALQAARDEVRAQAEAAVAAAAKARSEAAAQTTETSLKRKRSEDDEPKQDSVASELDIAVDLDGPNGPKRRRTMRVVAAKVAQTATYATIGAVAAWTALAFA